MEGHAPTLADVLESAARLQEVVPDAVLVGGSAAAWHASHRDSFDHDHVLPDLADRFDLDPRRHRGDRTGGSRTASSQGS
jgi:hypothetical protein